MRNLAPHDVESLGVIGAGTQGFMQILYACAVRKIKRVGLYDAFRKDYTGYIAALRRELGEEIEIKIYSSVGELLVKSQLVVTATNSHHPVLPDDPAVLAGKTYIAIGSYTPDMRELPDSLWQVAERVYTELPFACEESGDLYQPLKRGLLTVERINYLGNYLAQKVSAPTESDGRTVCFKSVGVGLFDLLCAEAIYNKAQEMQIGQIVEL
jgi:ornithine cyclodeaminase/alanine dehydrogenase-like protein (mu-crystallin family)